MSDEIAALARAGVPLERGLAELAHEMPGRLGRFAAELAARSGRGEPLAEALAASSSELPAVYAAVVAAGLRAGRLPAALEALAHAARRLAETRRSLILLTLYPLLVLAVVWTFLAFFTGLLAPQLLRSFESLGVPGTALFRPLAWCGRGARYWGPAGPAVLMLVAAWWWNASARATGGRPFAAQRLLGWVPWLGRMLRWSRTATFAEILALLVEHDVPLAEAIRLAASAAGDPRLLAMAEKLAAGAEGGTIAAADDCGLPPLLVWLVGGRRSEATLLPALRHAADTYHRRAQQQADLARVLLPLVLTVGISGGLTFLYALALFAPYVMMLRSLAKI